ncbi:hypothetical protein Pd630_LPD04245 [Rhodococcus opacus PD630]|nr:hypothetical protein Pd630_LPD04245 [Rhodococcus opacus PD630]
MPQVAVPNSATPASDGGRGPAGGASAPVPDSTVSETAHRHPPVRRGQSTESRQGSPLRSDQGGPAGCGW